MLVVSPVGRLDDTTGVHCFFLFASRSAPPGLIGLCFVPRLDRSIRLFGACMCVLHTVPCACVCGMCNTVPGSVYVYLVYVYLVHGAIFLRESAVEYILGAVTTTGLVHLSRHERTGTNTWLCWMSTGMLEKTFFLLKNTRTFREKSVECAHRDAMVFQCF